MIYNESIDLRAIGKPAIEGDRREKGKRASRAVFNHQAIYRKHPSVQAIVFAHPVNATAFSVTQSPFDARTIPESYVFLRDVERVPYGVQYRNDGSIADYVSTASPAAILENDGVLVTGSSVLDAFDRLEVLETTAEAVINSRAIGDVSAMPAVKMLLLDTDSKALMEATRDGEAGCFSAEETLALKVIARSLLSQALERTSA